MSFKRNMRIRKNNFKNTNSVTEATIKTEIVDDEISTIDFEVNGTVKSIEINYIGEVYDLVLATKGISFVHNPRTKKININNRKKLNLDGMSLLKYKGIINEFYLVKVYNWGSASIMADKETPSYTKENIQNNENIIGTSGEVFNFRPKGGRI